MIPPLMEFTSSEEVAIKKSQANSFSKKKKKPITKRAGGVAQGIGPSSSPSTTKKKNKTKHKVSGRL
jgi:hypothetical protein